MLLFFFNLFAQETDSVLVVSDGIDTTSQDNSDFGLKNRNQLFNNQMGIFNSEQRAKMWGLENQESLWSEIYLDKATYLFKMVYHPLEGLQPNNKISDNHIFVKEFIVCDHIYHLYKLEE